MSEQTKVASEHAAASAFPWSRQTEHDTVVHCSGMTLRDYFAGQAMQGWLASYGPGDGHPVQADRQDLVAKQAYQMADAMLAARGDA